MSEQYWASGRGCLPRRATFAHRGESARTDRFAAAKRGFTLIELLVVIAIIALLVSVLLPSLAKARLYAKRTACMGSLHAIGNAVCMYQGDYGECVPTAYRNFAAGSCANPWQSWRTCLLSYGNYAVYNCPAAVDTRTASGAPGEVFRSADEVKSTTLQNGTMSAGSIGVIWQSSLPGYETPDNTGTIYDPSFAPSCQAFSTIPGRAWRTPSQSVYAADACFDSVGTPSNPPATYPSISRPNFGTSVIHPPLSLDSADMRRRFADRHVGTNCLFLGGHVQNFRARDLDAMDPANQNCIWDTN